MADPTRDLESKLLGLPAEERARLAARLISSLEPGSDPDAEQAWLVEAACRLDELESGAVRSVPADTVFAKARSDA